MVTVSAVTFLLPDPGHRLAGARLRPDIPIAGDPLEFSRGGDHWELAIKQPPVNRMEYLVELAYPDGTREVVPDPGNPRQAGGAFGPRSVIEFSSYTPPRWLSAPSPPGASLAVDRWYSANANYARALRRYVIPALTSTLATSLRLGMGASLGALAMLHSYCRYPDVVDALFLQSGSFFRPRPGDQERRFPYYRRIADFVAGVDRDAFDPHLSRLLWQVCP